jgi:hypothetical protein
MRVISRGLLTLKHRSGPDVSRALALHVAQSPSRRYGRAMRGTLCIVILFLGCGEPILRNAPKPDPGAAAGVAAAAAAAVTLASPQTAAQRQEQQQKGEPDNRGVKVKETVPADVLDRLDHHPQDAGVDGAAAAAPAAVPATASPSTPAASTPASAPASSAPTSSAKQKPGARRPVIPAPSEYTPKQ